MRQVISEVVEATADVRHDLGVLVSPHSFASQQDRRKNGK